MNATLASRVAAAVAVVALPLGMLSVWAGAYIGSTDRYVATVAPLADDPAVKRVAVEYLERETMAVLDSGDRLGETLRTLDLSCIGVDSQLVGGIADLASEFLGSDGLGGVIGDQIRASIAETVHAGIVRAVDSSTFADVWVAANRQAHAEVLAALDGKPAPGGTDPDRVLLTLSRIADVVTGVLPCPDLLTPATASQIDLSFTLVNADDVAGARTGYQVLKVLRWVLPVLFVAGLVGALVLAPSWRRRLWQLGLGLVAGMGALELALLAIKASITSSGVDEEILDAVWGALTRSLHVSALVVAVVAALGSAALWFYDQVSRSQDRPSPDALPPLG